MFISDFSTLPLEKILPSHHPNRYPLQMQNPKG